MKKAEIKNRGFTLFEILVVLAIVSLVMLIAMPNYLKSRANAINTTCISNQRIIHTAATMYAIKEPDSLEPMGDRERVEALSSKGYLKGMNWAECPSSKDGSYDDYTLIFENNILSDVECSVNPSEHRWP